MSQDDVVTIVNENGTTTIVEKVDSGGEENVIEGAIIANTAGDYNPEDRDTSGVIVGPRIGGKK